jgi:hypothetical protein
MWEMTLFIIAAFLVGWNTRGILDRRIIESQQTEEPEMMWFNKQKSRWERVTEMHLRVADRAVVTIPVKLVEERRE